MPKPAVGSTTTGPVAAGSTAVLGEGSKASAGTLFDGEWLEGMSRKPVLLHPRECSCTSQYHYMLSVDGQAQNAQRGWFRTSGTKTNATQTLNAS